MNITQEFDTIAAISTPIGTGGVGIVRISGDNSFDIISKISKKADYPAGKICYGKIYDNDNLIDEVLILPFKSPKSFTGEDVIEIHCHGGVQVVQAVLNTVLKQGVRMAQRGEFTKRAFLNNKIDLSQAEAIDDLIHSKTTEFALKSAKNLSGALANKIKEIRANLFDCCSKIVAGIDFPEDVAEPEYDYLIKKFESNLKEINNILCYANTSNIMRQGIKVAIAGRPNVGKSSLFNSLLKFERAIVTDIAGTTRDVITETLDLGIPVTLIDTAGIRENNVDTVEQIGIEYSIQSVNEADLILFIYDISKGYCDEDEKIFNIIKDKKHIVIANKIDLLDDKSDINSHFSDELKISTINLSGLEELKEKIKSSVMDFSYENTEFVTNMRQQSCLLSCKESLKNALQSAKEHQLQDLIFIDLKSSLLCLDELTGEVVTDEILNNIFEHFCIGK